MRTTVSGTDKAELTIGKAKSDRARPASLAQSNRSLAPGDDKSRAGDDKSRAGIQETAFQPSGNGISGHADLLSLAAFGS